MKPLALLRVLSGEQAKVGVSGVVPLIRCVATIIGPVTLPTGPIISADENLLNCKQKEDLVSPFKLKCP